MRRRHLSWLVLPLCVASLAAPNGATAGRGGQSIDVYRPGFMGEDSLMPGDLDVRGRALLPTSTQRAAVRALDAKVEWNEFGTPRTLYNVSGHLSGPSVGDPVEIARAWVRDHAGLFRLDPADTVESTLALEANNALYDQTDNRRRMNGLKPLAKDSTLPHVVMFRQVFGGVRSSQDGMITLGLDRQNRVTHVSSSASGDTRVTNTATLSPVAAWTKAAADVGWHVKPADITVADKLVAKTFTGIQVKGQPEVQMTRLRTLPTPRDGARLVYESNVMDNTRVGTHEPLGYTSFVDAETGRVLLRMNAIDYFDPSMGAKINSQVPDPRWKYFPYIPPLPEPGVKTADVREVWCWTAGSGCTRVVGGSTGPRSNPALSFPYDTQPNGTTAPSSFTTAGNNSITSSSYLNHVGPEGRTALPKNDRNYTYEFTDQWHTSNCGYTINQTTGNFNDLDAAIANLFVGYGRMHDWSYYLGFTESTWNMQTHNFPQDGEAEDGIGQDPEKGQAQAGAFAGSVLYTGRDNANQRTMQDGVAPITNQYLWHPLQAGFYAPCVDGAYDMGIVAHEYTHAISNRMIGGPDAGIGGSEGPKMGESWSDLSAMEYVNGYGFAPIGAENPFAVGAYATGNLQEGIRNYSMDKSPLNYSDMGYDGNGATSPHADGEIWSASNYTVRKAMIELYDAEFPSDDKTLQYQCADALVPITECPGNRRWIQNLYDAFLLQDADAGMAGAAVAQIAADKMRYGQNGGPSPNEDTIWAAFASRGLGVKAEDAGFPDWSTPAAGDEALVTFKAVAAPQAGGGIPDETFVHVGHYSGRTAEATIAKASAGGFGEQVVPMVPGTYTFTARGDGYGLTRVTKTLRSGNTVVELPMRKNFASTTHGAEATGDGGNHEALIDDTEETNWAFLGEDIDDLVEGKGVTVDLAGGAQTVREVQISTVNRPQQENNAYDPIGQNRFAALRSFQVLACNAEGGDDCDDVDSFKVIYTSPEDGFPTGRPRPRTPDLSMRTFSVPATTATHLRIVVLTNQCTGNPLYTEEANPIHSTEPSNADCVNGMSGSQFANTDPDPENPPRPDGNNTQRHRVRISELQAYSTNTVPVVVQPQPPKEPTKPNPPQKPPTGPTGPTGPTQPQHPATGVSPLLGLLGLALAGGAALALRQRRTA